MKWLRSHALWIAGTALALLLFAGLWVYLRKPAPQPAASVALKNDVAQGLAGASQQHRMGKATARVSVKQRDPATGAVTGETDIDLGCEDDSSQEQAISGNQNASQSVTVAPPPVSASRPEWRLTGSARWDSLKPTPSEVSVGLSRRVLGPVSIGAEVAANPEALQQPRVGVTLSVEW